MRIRQAIQTIVTVGALSCAWFTAFAHNGVEHVLGTVKALGANSITVETTKHETSTVSVDRGTTFSHKGTAATLAELKGGDRVAIDGKDGEDKKLHAIAVKWGATTAAKTSKSAPAAKPVHKMDPNMKM
jgi:hypothetical protein